MRMAVRPSPGLNLAGGLLIGVIGVIIWTAQARVGPIDAPMPWIILVPAYMWGALQPSVQASVAAFALGLFQDFVGGGPLGPFALACLVAYGAGALQREALAGQSRAAVWIGFGVATFIAAAASWFTAWAGLGFPPSIGALFWQAVATVAVGPFIARLLGGFERVAAHEVAAP